jgi:rSAM/selenodomain-associated transferase 1
MNALVIMAKEPVIGKVKTRLSPPLSPEAAAGLYKNFLLDKIAQVNGITNVSPFIAYYPDTGLEFFKEHSPDGFELIEQVGNDLGERLAGISSELFKRGFEKVVMIDSDSPNLPTAYIREGFFKLEKADAVLGPTDDGGYYLVGMKKNLPEIFKNIPWSTREVSKVTLQRIMDIGKSLYLLPGWYDVDTAEDLERLKLEIGKTSNSESVEYFCKNTIESIKNIGEINNE